MTIEALSQPAKLKLVNLASLEELDAQLNPVDLGEKIGADFGRIKSQGASGERLHFLNTKNATYDMSLYFTSANTGPEGQAHMDRARLFLHSLVHPRLVANGPISSGGAPRVLIMWPGFMSVTVFVTELDFKYTRFNKEGTPVAWSCKIAFERVLDGFLSSEDVAGGRL